MLAQVDNLETIYFDKYIDGGKNDNNGTWRETSLGTVPTYIMMFFTIILKLFFVIRFFDR